MHVASLVLGSGVHVPVLQATHIRALLSMIRLYKAYILPHLEFCSPLWFGISDGLNNKLEDTNYFILRTILGLSKSTEYSHLLNMGHLQTWQEDFFKP